VQLESGQWDLERFGAELSAWAGKPLEPQTLAASYTASFQPVPALVHLAGQLKHHQPVALVGNATPWLRAQGLAHLGLEGVFNAEALSCEAGLRLPDQGLLLAAAEQLGLAPDTCLLIHRDPACLVAAQAVHLQTLDYTNPVMLMAELRRMGLAF
jgi:FMN phosphatase YigB (HAD superfamily)